MSTSTEDNMNSERGVVIAVGEDNNTSDKKKFFGDGKSGSSLALRLWMKNQFVIIAFLAQLAFLILIGIFARFGSESLPGTNANQVRLNAMYPMFQDVHVMIFTGFGFLMTFLKRYGYSSVSINMLLAATTIQWALIVIGFLSDEFSDHGKFPITLEMMVESDFGAAVILITMGAVLGKLSPTQYLVMVLIETPIAIVMKHVIISDIEANDGGDSIGTHMFGAYFGLACSAAMAKSKQRDHQNEGTRYNSDLFSMVGTVFLWTYWPSFNAATNGTDDSRQRSIINTYLAICSSTVTTFLISNAVNKERKFDMMHIANATLAGGVAVGTNANVILHPVYALLVGIIAGVISCLGFKFLTPFLANRLHIHDTCGVHNLHGMPSLIAGFSSCIFAASYNRQSYGMEAAEMYEKMGEYNYSSSNQALRQLYAILIILGTAIGSGFCTGLFLRLRIWNQVSRSGQYSDEDYFELPEEDENE